MGARHGQVTSAATAGRRSSRCRLIGPGNGSPSRHAAGALPADRVSTGLALAAVDRATFIVADERRCCIAVSSCPGPAHLSGGRLPSRYRRCPITGIRPSRIDAAANRQLLNRAPTRSNK